MLHKQGARQRGSLARRAVAIAPPRSRTEPRTEPNLVELEHDPHVVVDVVHPLTARVAGAAKPNADTAGGAVSSRGGWWRARAGRREDNARGAEEEESRVRERRDEGARAKPTARRRNAKAPGTRGWTLSMLPHILDHICLCSAHRPSLGSPTRSLPANTRPTRQRVTHVTPRGG